MRSQFVDQKLVPSLGPHLWQRSSTFRRPSDGSARVASSAAVPLATHNALQGHVGVGRQAGHLGRGQAPMKHNSHVTCTGRVRGVNGRGFHTSCMFPLYTYTMHLINLQIYVDISLGAPHGCELAADGLQGAVVSNWTRMPVKRHRSLHDVFLRQGMKTSHFKPKG